MTPAAWRALAHRHPGRVVYPEFNPDRPQPSWVPVKENRTWWERNKPRKATLRTVRSGWSTDPVPADPPLGGTFNPDPAGRAGLVPYQVDAEERRYLERLQNSLIDGRWPTRTRRRDL